MATQAASKTTTDHETIRRWAEARGGVPASVQGTEASGEESGVLRIDFPGRGQDDKLQHIGWEEWFRKFDEARLTLVYQEKTHDGKLSRFNKLVSRDG